MDTFEITAGELAELMLLEHEAADILRGAKALEGLLGLRRIRHIAGLPGAQYIASLQALISSIRDEKNRAKAQQQELRV